MITEDKYSYRSRLSPGGAWSDWYDLHSAATIIYSGVADTLGTHREVTSVTVTDDDGMEMQYRRIAAPVHEVVVRVIGTETPEALNWGRVTGAERFGVKTEFVRTLS